jgi:hypothetical protein
MAGIGEMTGGGAGGAGPLLVDPRPALLEVLSERRRAALAVAGSVEQVTWNVFRSLEQIEPRLWAPPLLQRAFGRGWRLPAGGLEPVRLTVWEPVAPPPARQDFLRRRALRGRLHPPPGRMRRGRVTPLSALRRRFAEEAAARRPLEPPLEIGAILRTPRHVVYLLPLLESEMEMEVACDRDRDAILRALDAGLYEVEASRGRERAFGLVLLYRDERTHLRSIERLRLYRAQPRRLARALAHRRRFDAARAARSLAPLRWRELALAVRRALRSGWVDGAQAMVLSRLLEYLDEVGLGDGSGGPGPQRARP